MPDHPGKTGAMLRAADWSHHPLGAPENWSASLKTTLGIVMHAPVPMLLLWGDAGHQFYNDAFLATDAGKSAGALGAPGRPPPSFLFSPVFDGDGAIAGSLGMSLDGDRLRVVADHLPALVSYMNTERRFTFVNLAYSRWFGRPREQIEGRTREELVDDPSTFAVMQQYEAQAFAGSPAAFELNFRRADGALVSLDAEYLPDIDPLTNKVRGIISVAHDVTERKRALIEAQAANATKSAFLANMSHELRTPLGAMVGFSGLLKEPSLSPLERERYIDIINRNGKALTRIIDDILELAKVESGHVGVEDSDFAPHALLEEGVDLFRETARQKGISLALVAAPARLRSDPMRFRQIAINLIGNAVKFTDAGGVRVMLGIEAETSRPERLNVELRVKDTGRGLSAAQAARLFTPFDQADNTSTRQFGGTGLGLAWSKRLAEALGGTIAVDDYAPGAGCTFTVRFTAAHAGTGQPAPAPRAAPSLESQPLKGRHVLIVDDSPDNLLLVQRLLTRRGARVAVAHDGSEALAKIAAERFDCVLMDIQMPRMDGYQAMRQLREAGYDVPVIALTAHAMAEDRERTRAAGFAEHLTKPLDFAEVVGAVARATQTLSP
jgi:PAS domain S-box-containing protein